MHFSLSSSSNYSFHVHCAVCCLLIWLQCVRSIFWSFRSSLHSPKCFAHTQTRNSNNKKAQASSTKYPCICTFAGFLSHRKMHSPTLFDCRILPVLPKYLCVIARGNWIIRTVSQRSEIVELHAHFSPHIFCLLFVQFDSFVHYHLHEPCHVSIAISLAFDRVVLPSIFFYFVYRAPNFILYCS